MSSNTKKQSRFPILKDRLNTLLEGRTTTEFAKAMGVSRATAGFYLNGNRVPDAKALREIAGNLGVSADYLIGLTSTRSTDARIQSVQSSTLLTESACERLCYEEDACIIAFLDELLEMPHDILLEISKKYYAHVFAVNAIKPVIESHTDFKGKKLPRVKIEVNGDSFPDIPIEEIGDYTRYALVHAFLKFADMEKTRLAIERRAEK